MKNLFLALMILFTSCIANSQENSQNVTNYNLSNSVWNIGISTKYSEVNSLSAGFVGVSGAYSISDNLELGLKAEGLYYDRKLNKLDPAKSYHLQSGHAGLFIDWHPFGKGDFHFSIPLFLGSGEISYIYDKEFRKEMKWYEEIIDKQIYSIWQLGIQAEARIYKNWSISADLGFRNTSPIEMIGTDKDILNQFEGGICFKYNFNVK